MALCVLQALLGSYDRSMFEPKFALPSMQVDVRSVRIPKVVRTKNWFQSELFNLHGFRSSSIDRADAFPQTCV